jgi:uncharacterized membrane protein YkoI
MESSGKDIRQGGESMKKLMIAFAIAALAVPVGFAQQSKTKAATTKTASNKPVMHTVSMQALPAPVQATVQKSVGTGKVTKVETITTNGTTVYEAFFREGKKRETVKVDAAGNVVK